MKEKLTLEMLLDLPNYIIEKSLSKKNSFLHLLSEKMCDKYYYRELKRDLCLFFNDFNDLKYVLGVDVDMKINCTANYQYNECKKAKNTSDRICALVSKKIDNELLLEEIYHNIIKLADELTPNEAIYFVGAFF